MGDFSNRHPDVPPFIHTFSNMSWQWTAKYLNAPVNPASSTATANMAVYIPVSLSWTYPVKRLFWWNGSSTTGNADVGIYDSEGDLVVSGGGNIVRSGASAPQFVSVNALLMPGNYYFAFVVNGTTNAVLGGTISLVAGRQSGCLQQSLASPTLPATATFAQWTAVAVPIIGITTTDTGY